MNCRERTGPLREEGEVVLQLVWRVRCLQGQTPGCLPRSEGYPSLGCCNVVRGDSGLHSHQAAGTDM